MSQINKVVYKDEPTLFKDISEWSVEETKEHRRGGSFYVSHIVELTKEMLVKWCPEIKEPKKYVGFWQTNTVIWDDSWGYDKKFSELCRVERKTITTTGEYFELVNKK